MSRKLTEFEDLMDKSRLTDESMRSEIPIMASTMYENYLEELKIKRWIAKNERTHKAATIKKQSSFNVF